ncbi:MAG TPA: glycosyltransferase [Allosphingosinicella sp.]|jgi:glycosyltransferase involved in cell wall biosynthesis
MAASPSDDPRPVAATFRSRLFNASEGFVQAQAARLTRYRPVVAGLHHIGNVRAELQDRLLLAASASERLRFQLLGAVGPMAARLRPFSPSVIHAHFGTDGLLALPLARSLGVPLVTTLRGYDLNLSRARLLSSGKATWIRYALRRRRLMEEGDLFLAVSESMRARAVALGYPEDRTLTHYNGVDLARFCPGDSPREEGLVLHVANLVRKKGASHLLRAFAKVKAQLPAARLVLVGEGPLEPQLRRQVSELGLGGSIEFLGHRTAEEVAQWMRRASVLAAPSLTGRSGDAEGLPNVVVEAAASGLPVVATRHAGIPEAVLDGETGLLVPEHDVAALAGALHTLLREPERVRAMGMAGRRLAEQRFDADRQMERLQCHYDRLRSR